MRPIEHIYKLLFKNERGVFVLYNLFILYKLLKSRSDPSDRVCVCFYSCSFVIRKIEKRQSHTSH
jgi:hypothetical protein